VIVTAAAVSNTGSQHAFMSFAVATVGPPPVVVSVPADFRALEVSNNDEVRASATTLVTGLPPGTPITFTAKYRVDPGGGSAQATFGSREIVVMPLPGAVLTEE
jgi:hypothetical protein